MKALIFSSSMLLTIILFITACKEEDDMLCTESIWHEDADGDGLGNPDVSVLDCVQPEGFVSNSDDTDDTLSDTDCPPQIIQAGPNTTTLIPVELSDRGVCDEILSFIPQVSIIEDGQNRIIESNSIPDHNVGLFGMMQGALNPHAIAEVKKIHSVPLNPSLSGIITTLWDTNIGPAYEFGILLNGIVLDPEAAEPFPHEGFFATNINLEWNLDAMVINLGLDCNNAHVQPSGKYHYHGAPTLYLESLNITGDEMKMVGYAADGFPIYYKYGYNDANDSSSGMKSLISSHELKSGSRPGDGSTAPCGVYNGVYTNDWQFVDGLGDLDECNGRTGVTPEYPNGTYYYVITDEYPFVPRCLKGNPSEDFRLQ